jgi:hypothetical protein
MKKEETKSQEPPSEKELVKMSARAWSRNPPYLLAILSVLVLVGGSGPVVRWQDTTGQSRSQALEEEDSTDCLTKNIILEQSKQPSHIDLNALNHEFMACMTSKGWKATGVENSSQGHP